MKQATKNKEDIIIIAADQNGFTMISNNITRNTNLSDNAKSLYIYLKSHNQESFYLSQRLIANYFHKSIDKIQRAISELKENGFLTIEQKPNENAYIYHLYDKTTIIEKIEDEEILFNKILYGEIPIIKLDYLIKQKQITIELYNKVMKRIVKIAKNRNWLNDSNENE